VLYFPYLGESPHCTHLTQKLHGGWCPRHNHVCQVSNWNLHGLRFLPRDAMHKRGYCRHAVSVRPSVRYVPVSDHSDENGLINISSQFFHHAVAQSLWFYQHQTFSQNSDGVTLCGGTKYRWGIKILRFSTNKSLYLAKDTRYRHSYYGRRIGNRTQAFKWYLFQCSFSDL